METADGAARVHDDFALGVAAQADLGTIDGVFGTCIGPVLYDQVGHDFAFKCRLPDTNPQMCDPGFLRFIARGLARHLANRLESRTLQENASPYRSYSRFSLPKAA